MRKIVFFICIIVVFNFMIQAVEENRFRLEGLVNPESIIVDSDNIYISDGATVNIFSALYIPIGGNYVGSGRAEENKFRYKTVNLYNSSLPELPEVPFWCDLLSYPSKPFSVFFV
ncbi:MAG: hypothetical protein ABFR75_13510 [Acidobacteriota bacterium]